MRRYDFRHLKAFLSVAENLHFSRAAEHEGLSQPALSRTILELEHTLGVSLFRRTTRQVELTQAGTEFLREIQLALRQIDHAETAARDTAAGISGHLRIAYMDFAINGRLPELLGAFRAHRPKIRLELSFVATSRQQKALMENEIDIGFLIGAADSARMENFPFHTEDYVALLPEAHRLANVRTLRLEDLAQEPFVLGNEAVWTAHRQRVFALCHEAGFFPTIVQEAPSSEGIFGLVAAGLGVSIYAGCVRNVQRRGLVIRDLADVSSRIPIYAAWDSGMASPSITQFVDFLKAFEGSASSRQQAAPLHSRAGSVKFGS